MECVKFQLSAYIRVMKQDGTAVIIVPFNLRGVFFYFEGRNYVSKKIKRNEKLNCKGGQAYVEED